MIDTSIESERVNHVAALRFTASNADDAAAFDFGDLANQRTDCAGGSRDDHGLARPWLADIEQTKDNVAGAKS
jgi:hypothetical protein